MSTAPLGAYNLDWTCRCCLQNVAILPLTSNQSEPNSIVSDLKVMAEEPIGDVLMEFANVQFAPDDGLPQKVCDKCITTLRSAFVFRKMCQESDVKLREYFWDHSTVNPIYDDEAMRFDDIDYTKDSDDEPTSDSRNELPADLPVTEEPTFDQVKNKSDAVSGIDAAMQPVVVLVDFRVNRADSAPCDPPRESEENAKSNTKTVKESSSKSNGPRANVKLKTNCDGNSWIYKCTKCSHRKSCVNFFKIRNGHALHGKVVLQPPVEKNSIRIVTCDICKEQLTCDRRNLVVHMRKHLRNNKLRKLCESCDKSFRHQKGLAAHILAVHSGDRPYKCDVCDKAYAEKACLSRHKKTHLAVKPFICTHCDKGFVERRSFTVHSRTHMEPHQLDSFKTKLCELCGQSFIDKRSLIGHMRAVHTGERPFKCDICDKAFHRKPSFFRHKNSHLAVKPYACTHCDKSFAARKNLTVHVRIHTGERPYVCTRCDKSFYSVTNYRAHVRIHTGERPFRCNQCGETFSQSQSLLKHRRKFDHFDPPAAPFPDQP